MKPVIAALLAIGTFGAQSPFACNLKALTSEERRQHATLNKQLAAAVADMRELTDGYAFRILPDRLSPTATAEWIVLEQKCCPFFGFELRLLAERGPVWLHVTGRPGVKDFIREEFKFGK